MQQRIASVVGYLFGISFIVIAIGSYVIYAQATITGEWRIDARSEKQKDPNKVQLTLERKTDRNNHSHSTGYPLDELKGLSRDQMQSGRASFRIEREAGSIQCDGTFTDGKGSGSFTFTANGAFVSGMQSRGFTLTDEKQFVATTLDLTLGFVDELRSAGFGNLDVDDLFKARIFKVTPQFAAEMRLTGFANLGLEELVKARIFKIDADYVRQVKDMGFDNKAFEGLVKFRIFKVTPEFLAEVKAEGLANVSSEDIVKLRIFKIDADYIRRARAVNPNITVEELVTMKIGIHQKRDDN